MCEQKIHETREEIKAVKEKLQSLEASRLCSILAGYRPEIGYLLQTVYMCAYEDQLIHVD